MIVPSIEADGSFSEIITDSPKRGFERAVVDPTPFQYETEVKRDYYDPMDFAFRIDSERVATVVVLVNVKFAHSSPSHDIWRKTVEEHIKKHAPWIFSYASRERRPQPIGYEK